MKHTAFKISYNLIASIRFLKWFLILVLLRQFCMYTEYSPSTQTSLLLQIYIIELPYNWRATFLKPITRRILTKMTNDTPRSKFQLMFSPRKGKFCQLKYCSLLLLCLTHLFYHIERKTGSWYLRL